MKLNSLPDINFVKHRKNTNKKRKQSFKQKNTSSMHTMNEHATDTVKKFPEKNNSINRTINKTKLLA